MKITLADGSGTIDLKYLVEDVDRHGNVRVYFRRSKGAPKIRLKQPLGGDAFMAEYKAALNGEIPEPAKKLSVASDAPQGSLRAIAAEYYQSAAFKGLHPQVQKRRRTILDGICAEKTPTGVERGDLSLAAMQKRHVLKMRDRLDHVPGSANDLLKTLRGVFKWAADAEHVPEDYNPAAAVPYFTIESDGFHTWAVEEVQQYEARHPIGTKARLALGLFLYLGARVSDTRTFGPQMERNGALHFQEVKGRKKKIKDRVIPILPVLREIIDASPSGHLAYLVTEFGKPFSTKGLSNRFKKWCVDADLPGCSAHGLRKAGATFAAENGATEHQLMAIYGWDSPKQAALYTKKANRQKLTADAIHLVAPEQKQSKSVPPQREVEKSGTIFGEKAN